MKKVDFLFIYEVKNRELENITLLAAELERRGYTTAFINSWTSMYSSFESYDAEVVVLSACYNTGTYHYFTHHASKFRKVVNMQWEQVIKNGYAFAEVPTSWTFSGEGLRNRHICWGNNTKERLHTRFGVPYEYLKVCGHIALDFYKPEFREFVIPREKLFTENGLDPNKKTALFIASFAMANMPDRLLAISSDTLKDIDVKTARQSQSDLIEWFSKVVPKHPDIQFVYRYHHSEANDERLKKLEETVDNFYCISKEAIKHWIIACDKIYNWESTSAIEVYVADKQNFVLRPIELPWEVDLPLFKNADIITDADGFDKSMALDCDVKNQPYDDEVMHDYYDMDGRFTFHKICDLLEETYASTEYSSHQYEKHNNKLTRFIRDAYMNMVYSDFTANMVKRIHKSKWNGPFFRFIKSKEVPVPMKKTEEYQYNLSRKTLNYSSPEEIRAMLDRYKNILENCKKYIER